MLYVNLKIYSRFHIKWSFLKPERSLDLTSTTLCHFQHIPWGNQRSQDNSETELKASNFECFPNPLMQINNVIF